MASTEQWVAKVGEHALTTKKLQCGIDYIEKGTEVVVLEVAEFHGYTIRPVANGSTSIECGWDGIEPLPVPTKRPTVDISELMYNIQTSLTSDSSALKRYEETAAGLERLIRELSDSDSKYVVKLSIVPQTGVDINAKFEIALNAFGVDHLNDFREVAVKMLKKQLENVNRWISDLETKYTTLDKVCNPD